MKQRHIQSFLMVSAAFFAISAPSGGARANQSPFEASPVRQVAQARVQSVRTTTEKRRDSQRSDDDTIG
ncbi:hypothetical protein BVER_01170c [Candidatus Burkholderia verschuerenii]|uniref:Outer membrane protein n=1 Tax=Candidatus Burkholderia verschuerenii TaxID=242163 RepID=A0A0L0MA22_9BURK|nr:hypothetical protein [Candidatus Burkholderia verschuerenii]KND59228.1 hypothetical protein BVER_01170c [Candidatus Burkholderia verschuerenii]